MRDGGTEPHLESFGGCLMGQLCPPSLLVAISVLEGMFFRQHGLASMSLSYAQQTHPGQDREAVLALRRLAGELLSDVDWHVVVYTYMGVYPRTPGGATTLLAAAARLAVRTGAARLIVKTTAEARRIPTVAENIAALETAAAVAAGEVAACPPAPEAVPDNGIYAEARALVDAVLDLGPDLGRALTRAFRLGHLDVPFCLHPDNAGRARGRLDDDGRLRWARTGSMPLRPDPAPGHTELTSTGLLTALSYVERKFDDAALEGCLEGATS
jgi:methylaspartate mutase epsilon subunit